jgi:hypothetical protein
MFGSSLPSALGWFGSHQSLLGCSSRHCHGINFTHQLSKIREALPTVVRHQRMQIEGEYWPKVAVAKTRHPDADFYDKHKGKQIQGPSATLPQSTAQGQSDGDPDYHHSTYIWRKLIPEKKRPHQKEETTYDLHRCIETPPTVGKSTPLNRAGRRHALSEHLIATVLAGQCLGRYSGAATVAEQP